MSFSIVVTRKKNGKIGMYGLSKVKEISYSFLNQILDEVISHDCYNFVNGYTGYNHVYIARKDQLKATFTTPWHTFAYQVISFELCNAHATFHRHMNRVFEPYIEMFIRDF